MSSHDYVFVDKLGRICLDILKGVRHVLECSRVLIIPRIQTSGPPRSRSAPSCSRYRRCSARPIPTTRLQPTSPSTTRKTRRMRSASAGSGQRSTHPHDHVQMRVHVRRYDCGVRSVFEEEGITTSYVFALWPWRACSGSLFRSGKSYKDMLMIKVYYIRGQDHNRVCARRCMLPS
jgi:hypothetical protein